jgi:hypothetical protein
LVTLGAMFIFRLLLPDYFATMPTGQRRYSRPIFGNIRASVYI